MIFTRKTLKYMFFYVKLIDDGKRPQKNLDTFNWTQNVNLWRLWRENYVKVFIYFKVNVFKYLLLSINNQISNSKISNICKIKTVSLNKIKNLFVSVLLRNDWISSVDLNKVGCKLHFWYKITSLSLYYIIHSAY